MLTALPAAAAGAVLPRELVDGGRTPTVRRFVALLGRALRDPLAVVIVVPGLLVFAAVAVERR
jgi:hypothetical protein